MNSEIYYYLAGYASFLTYIGLKLILLIIFRLGSFVNYFPSDLKFVPDVPINLQDDLKNYPRSIFD